MMMKRCRFLLLGLLIIIMSAFPGPVKAQDDEIQFIATVDRTQVSTNDVITLQLTLDGTNRASSQPKLVLEGFSILSSNQSSQFSMINGNTTAQVIYTYRIQPSRSGTLTIPPVEIQAKDKTYTTQPIQIEVTEGNSDEPAQPGVDNESQSFSQGVIVKAEVDNVNPVIGQQIIYRFILYQAVQFFSQPQLDLPDFNQFLTYELPERDQSYEVIDGNEYLVSEIRRALFPTVVGRLTIPPARLSVPGDIFTEAVDVSTDEVVVDVKALPDGTPQSFKGAVGQFTIEASVQPVSTRANEPVTLIVRVHGEGDLNNLSDPTEILEDGLDQARVYDPKITTTFDQAADSIRGDKMYERLILPETEGTLIIPAFTLVFYHPQSQSYQQVETQLLTVEVTPGETAPSDPLVVQNGADVVVLASDVRHIKAVPPSLSTAAPSLLKQPFYWIAWGFPALMFLGVWMWNRRRQQLDSDVVLSRTIRAFRVARKRLKDVRRRLNNDDHAVYSAVSGALVDYLGDKLNLPATGLTRDVMHASLLERGVPQQVISEYQDCLDWADSGRFAPVAAGRSPSELVQKAETILSSLEEKLS